MASMKRTLLALMMLLLLGCTKGNTDPAAAATVMPTLEPTPKPKVVVLAPEIETLPPSTPIPTPTPSPTPTPEP
ncbi:MAG: hypothetical protein Q4A88_03085, partial [Clostridia bacterium]|nr:hypothetical protein [Clostridia bacterium]